MAQKKTYRSMQGKVVDMELLAQKHELTPAIGNARVNARGDEIGPGGKIIRKREDIMAEYYENNPNAVKDEQFVRPRSNPAPVAKTSPNVSPTSSHVETTKKTLPKKEVKNDHSEN